MRLICILLILILFSCNISKIKDAERKKTFKTFLKGFKPLSLPFKANTSCYSLDTLISVRLDQPIDTLFLGAGMYASIGILPDTTNFYSLVYCGAATCWLPSLINFSKDGSLLSKAQISHGCGAGCGYICKDSLVINSISDIELIYIEETTECESLNKEKPVTWHKTTDITKISIDKAGKIISKLNR